MKIDSKSFGIQTKKGLFEFIRSGGIIYIGHHAIRLSYNYPFMNIELFYHGQQVDDNILLQGSVKPDYSKKQEIQEFESKSEEEDIFGDAI